MNTYNINTKKNLKVFTQPLNLKRVTDIVDAWYFVPTNDPNTSYHIVAGPYFLKDVSKASMSECKNTFGPIKPKDCFLLNEMLCWDGMGFGVWVLDSKKNLKWLNLNFNSEGELNEYDTKEANNLKVDLDHYKELLKPFKTALMLMGIDITPNPERI